MAQDIEFLTPLEHIKTRPGMYAATDSPKTLVRELVDNATDEILNSFANRVEIIYDKSSCTVRDNGRGLPLYQVPEFDNQIAAKLLLTELFSGGKFSHVNYKYSSGLHGVGLCVVNALSEKVSVSINSKEEDSFYTLILENGTPKREDLDVYESRYWWTTEITFYPNKKYFDSLRMVLDVLSLQLTKKLYPKTKITVNSKDIKPFDFETVIGDKLLGNYVFQVTQEIDNVKFDLHFGWSAGEFNQVSKGAVNLVPVHVGWHEKIAKNKIGQALAQKSDSIKSGEATYGLRLFASVFTQDPVFGGQVKDRLSKIGDLPADFEEKLYKAILKELNKEKNEESVKAIIRKIVAYKKKLESLDDVDYINDIVRKGDDKRKRYGVGVGVFDCSCKDRTKAELYIVEGDSAMGHLRRTRNTLTQAVLPLRGKPLNAIVKDDIKTVLENQEMEMLINAIGAGAFQTVDLNVMRYGKIIIAADADADGAQISNLILGALVYIVPEVVEAGHVYEVISPLYQQDGKYHYRLSDVNTNKPFDRFKGLGSMNEDEVEQIIINPETRRLRQINLDDRPTILDIMQTSARKKEIMVEGGIIKEWS